MERLEEQQRYEAETSFVVFLLTLSSLNFSKSLDQLLSNNNTVSILTFLQRQKSHIGKIQGVRLL